MHASLLVLLGFGCGTQTDLSYDEYVQEYRAENGPFLECGVDLARCEGGPGAAAACLADGISTCRQVEHVFVDEDGETATTFVTRTDDSCEIIVLRDLGRGSVGVDYQRERCDAVEIDHTAPCIRFRRCDVEMRWDERRSG